MKKGEIYEGIIEKVEFPNKGFVWVDDQKVIVKNGIPGQKVRFMINKKRSGRAEGRLLEVLEKSPLETREPACQEFPACGGCMYQTMSYEEQKEMKERQVRELLDGAVLYIRIYFLGMPAMALYNFGNAVCSAFGDTKKPLYYLGAAGIVNIVLNLFFVIVCKMDVAGVAAASIISQYLSAFLILRALIKVGGDYALRLSKLRFDKRMAGYLIQIGLPAGLQNGIFQVANLFIQAGVNTFDATMVAGNSAAANADALLYDSMAAFYTACGSFMGQNYGAGKRKRVRNSYLVSLAYSFGIGTIGGIALVIFGRQFLGLFTNDPAVVDAGMKRLTIMGFSYGFSAFMDSAIAASRALGKSVIPTVIVIIGSCIFRMVWVNTVFAHFKTIPSLYLLYIFSWGITAVVEIIYWVHVYRNTKIG